MNIGEVRKILNPQFGYIAKSSGEFLYSHHHMVWSIFKKISSYVPSLNEREKELLELACLVHDIGKMKFEIQEALKSGKKPKIPHKITVESELEDYFKSCNINISPTDLKFVLDIIRTHHGVSERDIEEIDTSGAGFFTLLLTTADWLASMDYLSIETLEKLNSLYRDKIVFTAFQCSRFSSPTYIKIIDIAAKEYVNYGWKAICFPENSVVFIGKHDFKLPEKSKIANEILKCVIKESIKLQNPIPSRPDRELIVSIAKYFPVEFLETHKDKILDALSNIDFRGFTFLKYIYELIKLTGQKLNSKIEESIDLLSSAFASSGSLKTRAKDELKKKFDEVNDIKQGLNAMFNEIELDKLLPEKILSDLSFTENNLRNMTKDDLFNILYSVAKNCILRDIKENLLNYLESIISLEEEIDFKTLASIIFEKYKTYKKTLVAEKGACEICGCPVAYKMQPALKLFKAPQAFSQIKAKYAYRSICPFCAYDNLMLRHEVSEKKVRIYMKIKSKIPDFFLNYEELRLLVNRAYSATRNFRNIVKFKEREEFKNLPFPEKIEVPIGEERKNFLSEEVLKTENCILLKLDDINENDFSPKDIRVKYEPLYHLLKLLGFEVAIGTEEQEELFGEKIETNLENYYKSLATIILAQINPKKSRNYIYARNLLEKSPSITIRAIGDYIDKKSLQENLIRCLIKGMIKSRIIISGG